jgi:hypothetical protein
LIRSRIEFPILGNGIWLNCHSVQLCVFFHTWQAQLTLLCLELVVILSQNGPHSKGAYWHMTYPLAKKSAFWWMISLLLVLYHCFRNLSSYHVGVIILIRCVFWTLGMLGDCGRWRGPGCPGPAWPYPA